MKFLLSIIAIFVNIFASSNINITNGYIILDKDTNNAIAYMDIENKLNKELNIINVKSDIAKLTQLYVNSELPGGMKISGDVQNITINAKDTISLSPLKYYIQFTDLSKTFKSKDIINFTLYFSNKEVKKLKFKVQ
jgi:copper(I)-binding protein